MAAPRIAASTPSPPPNVDHIHTPPTPRLGFGDSWEPFSPRKSSRLAASSKSKSATASARTPSPSAATHRAARQVRSPDSRKRRAQQLESARLANVGALSPAATPQKKKMPASAAHFLSPEDAAKTSKKGAAAAEGSSHTNTRVGLGMLPTPAKTPSKKKHAASENESNIAAIARNLFHTDVDEVMSSPSRRRPKKYTGVSLESFTAVEEEEPIAIFTDSQDRVPEVDHSTENPFYGDGAAAPSSPTAQPHSESPRRRSKRSHVVSIPGEGQQTVEDATRREDGLVYVFRGKKIFRKFDDSSAAQEEDILEGATPGKRLTRSAIKPRLLFPRDESSSVLSEARNGATAAGGTTEDEEADTDIEDHNLHGADVEEDAAEEDESPLNTPADLVEDDVAPNTPPNAPKFAPVSPPVTAARTTRRSGGGAKAAEERELTPVRGSGRTKKRSPFDSWRQTKSGAAAAGHKRPVDELGTAVPAAAAKRSRA